ncbi:peptide-methionine (S)-S-oxide reductase MsrA [Lacibacter sp. H407]|uniref:peptide-methionine (S)-S-oxide reductase MsrA n=1 Tax=Lacibacter sp. H407 TaxID=3133423 RepID=UPI0030BA8D42
MWSKLLFNTSVALGSFLFFSCVTSEPNNKMMNDNLNTVAFTGSTGNEAAIDTATFGAGCFWCVEAIFQQVEGVLKVTSGYCGGHVVNPTYEQVNTKTTGHAEVAQIVFDPKKISFDELLEIFWQTHDPTTLNRQGNDAGPQYRSAVFYHNAEQKQKAEQYKAALDKSGAFDNPIVTTIEAYKNYSEAENYHQNYYNNNKNSNPYCYYVIKPKLEKFDKVFKDKKRKN